MQYLLLLLFVGYSCTLKLLISNGSEFFFDKTDYVEVVHTHFNNNLLNDLEKLAETRRIYRGSKTKIKYYAFVVSIHVLGQFRCAGSIIKSDLVITACSCVQLLWNNRFYRENPKVLSVRVGSTFHQGGGEELLAQEVYFHPIYNPRTLANNLAIIRLDRRLHFKKRKVKKITLATKGRNWHEVGKIKLLGWGATSRTNTINKLWNSRLSTVDLLVYPLSECKDIYQRRYVTKRHFCAGFISFGGGACNGDVGGPGVIDGELVGVVSFGSPACGAPDSPTVFTKVVYYLNWIEDVMDMVPPRKKGTTKSSLDKDWENHWYFGTANSDDNNMVPSKINTKPNSNEINITPIISKENNDEPEIATRNEQDWKIEEENYNFKKDLLISKELNLNKEIAQDNLNKLRKYANNVTIMVDFDEK